MLNYIRHLNPDFEKQFHESRRVWFGHLVSQDGGDDEVERVRSFLSEHFRTELSVTEIEPDFEYVIYDSDSNGNNYDNLCHIAQKRSDYRNK